MSPQVRTQLWDLGYLSIQSLESELGILASGRNEMYGCIFGRDSLITALLLLRAHPEQNPYFLTLIRKILVNLAELQGTQVVIESGEEPGKIIHEYRPEGHEHLTKLGNPGWYLYPDQVMRNYDSVDSTPLFLLAVHAYYSASQDEEFMRQIQPHVDAALTWLLTYGDSNRDGFIDYHFHPDRKSGGLRTQSWMDSRESVFFEESEEQPKYPIAPVEVQAYSWAALKLWGKHEEAAKLKKLFNEKFMLKHGSKEKLRVTLPFALDGAGKPLTSLRSSTGHVLWAQVGGESILDSAYVGAVVKNLLRADLYSSRAGLRTLSKRSRMFDAGSYHNGSIWPHDTALCAEGLELFGYVKEARILRQALLRAYRHFATPLELFVYSRGKFGEYTGPQGQGACRTQAWSAASLLSLLAHE